VKVAAVRPETRSGTQADATRCGSITHRIKVGGRVPSVDLTGLGLELREADAIRFED
jgi:hypothetical protein